MRTRTPLLLLCLNAVPALCVGQHTHQFEIGAFGSYTRYDRAFVLDKQIGGGGRLGYFFSPVIGIEVDAGYQQPTPAAGGTNATLSLGSASLVLNMGNAHNLFYILGGYSRLAFGDRPGYTFTDNGVHGAIGDRMFLGERVALRIEGRAIYSPSSGFSGGNWAGHVVGSAGLSIFTGPSALRDADQDGVADRKDACPGTPAGAVVDARGCPSDSDRDKVYNGLDACPNTVEGAEVDARGCPKDADADGVYDGLDKCPNTPTGARVDAQGCPTDADRDGVPDGTDQCPNTSVGATVDTTGCPLDSDHDGVPDGIDKCPNTPARTEVDTAGCQRASDTDGDGQVPRDGCRHARRCGGMPDPLYRGKDPRRPPWCDVRDGSLGVETGLVHDSRHRGGVARRQPRHQDRNRGTYGRYGFVGDQHSPVAGARRCRPHLSGR